MLLDVFRMTESQDGRTVEVLGLPGAVDEELLSLYFENKRRSGGGPLVSVEKSGDCALLVFEDAEGKCGVGERLTFVLLLKRRGCVYLLFSTVIFMLQFFSSGRSSAFQRAPCSA